MNSSTVTPYIYIDGCNNNTDINLPGGSDARNLTFNNALYGQKYTFILWAYVNNQRGSGLLESESTTQSTEIGSYNSTNVFLGLLLLFRFMSWVQKLLCYM